MKQKLLFITLSSTLFLVGCSSTKEVTREQAQEAATTALNKEAPGYTQLVITTKVTKIKIDFNSEDLSDSKMQEIEDSIKETTLSTYGVEDVGKAKASDPITDGIDAYRTIILPSESNGTKFYVSGDKVSYVIDIDTDSLKSNTKYEYNEYGYLLKETSTITTTVSVSLLSIEYNSNVSYTKSYKYSK